MIAKGFNFTFTYDGTTQGNTDRATFKAVCDAELSNDNCISSVNSVRSSFASLDGNVVSGEIYYMLTNSGINALNSFFSTCQTEKAKTTVSFAYYVKYTLTATKSTENPVSEVKNPIT